MKPRNITNNLLIIVIIAAFMAACMIPSMYAQTAPKKDDKAKKEAVKDKGKVAKDLQEGEVTGWRIKDFQPYIKAMKDLEKLNKEYNENVLKLAIDEYSTGLDILEDMENDILKLVSANKEKKNLNERWYWQEVDRKNAEHRQITGLKYEAKMKSITFFTRAVNHLDEVQMTEVRNDPKFVNFQTRLFQVYVSTQYDLNNYKPCIPILERYITINDKTKGDMWAYKYLSSCYAYMETVSTRYKNAPESEIVQYRQKKNRYLLQSVELKYGVDSPQYKQLQEYVEKDEKKSEKLNDFK